MPESRLLATCLRRVGLCAGLLAFIAQVVAWSVTMPTAALAGLRGGVTAGVITICTAGGLKRVKVDADGQALPDQGGDAGQSGDSRGHCPLCPVVGGAGLPPDPQPSVPSPHMAKAGPHGWPGVPAAAGRVVTGLQARAPPAVG